jgi:uncharacterized delta-60 repeat protein
MKKRYLTSLIAILLSIQHSNAQNAGDLDLTFGINGSVITDLGIGYDQCSGLVVQPDQKIVIAGRAYITDWWYPTLIRINTDGTLDSTFNGDGIASGDVQHSTTLYAEADALVMQPDGKFLYTFYLDFFGGDGLAVTRFNSDGSIDTDFGVNGTTTVIAMAYSNYSNSLLLQGDGKILVVGSGQEYENAPSAAVAVRFTADGLLDETFADDGIFTFSQGNGTLGIDAKQSTDGKIVMACSTGYSGYQDYVIIRLNDNGTFDNTFNEDGIVNFNISGLFDAPQFLTLREDGSIIVVGYSYSDDGTNIDWAMVSLTSGGELDSEFGNDGVVIAALGDGDDIAESVAIAPDGKIIVAGYYEDFFIYGAVLRYNANGELDNSFGTNGLALIDAYSYHLENVKLQADGKIVVCGWTGYSDTNEHHFTASRLLYDGVNVVNENATDNKIHIYPNPSNEQFFLCFSDGMSGNFNRISIMDQSGKLVWQLSQVTQNMQVDVSHLAEGIYTVLVQRDVSIISRTFVITR